MSGANCKHGLSLDDGHRCTLCFMEASRSSEEAHGVWHSDRRERIATAAMQGMLAGNEGELFFDNVAHDSVRYADALIKELDCDA